MNVEERVRKCVRIVLRPTVREPSPGLMEVETHFYDGVGYITPLMHSRTKLWHISLDRPRIAEQWVDPLSVSAGGFTTKREALLALEDPKRHFELNAIGKGTV